MIKYLRRALTKAHIRKARRWARKYGPPVIATPWDAWRLDDDRADALRLAVGRINQRLAADIAENARLGRPYLEGWMLPGEGVIDLAPSKDTTTEGEGS